MRYFVGLDWGGTTHAVCVLDTDGREFARFAVAHTDEGLAELCRRLAGLAPAAEVPVNFSTPAARTYIKAGSAREPIAVRTSSVPPPAASSIRSSRLSIR